MVRGRSNDEGADHLVGGVDVPEGVIVAPEEEVAKACKGCLKDGVAQLE